MRDFLAVGPPVIDNRTDLRGKNLLITGGSMGIGRATVELCLRAGARVVLCARGQEAIDGTVEALQEKGYQQVRGIAADVTDAVRMDAAMTFVEESFGTLHGVAHAAGVYGPIGQVVDVDPALWMKAVENNLFGTFVTVRQACLRFRSSGGGRIVLFSGGGASTAFPNYTSYACSKVAMVRFAETVAVEMSADGIEINCVSPGFVATRMHEQTLASGPDRAGREFWNSTREWLSAGGLSAGVGGSAAAYLLSDAARGISGKLVAAQHDDWSDWHRHLAELQGSELFTLRRVLPRERGADWQ